MSDTSTSPSAAAPAAEGLFSVSKGVDFYTFASGPAFGVQVTAPAITRDSGPAQNFTHQNLQIDSANIPGWFNYTGTLSWSAIRNGATAGTGFEQINSFTGQTEGGTMSVMLNTPSSTGPGFALSYGFYDAGSGIGTPLTNQDQLYVYVSDNYATWMGDLVNAYPQAGDCPFHQFALPGAHDAGMCTMSTVQAILNSPFSQALLDALKVLSPVLGELVISLAPRAITNLAITQKDTVTTMLSLGTRYFDFRPGTLASQIAAFSPGVRYHQHAVIPGYPYVSFLQDVLVWLHAHPSEIVVVSANTQGFAEASMYPTPQQLDTDLAAAFTNTGLTGAIGIGDKTSLAKTVNELLQSNTRLIFLNQISSPPETTKYDSYSDSLYATVTPGPILQALGQMNAADQAKYDYTVLQMQGTATNLGAPVIVPSIATESNASSPLLSTKASFDIATNPWLQQNVSKNLSNSGLVVFLNDFVDNCMVSTAITVTKQRMGLQ
ncbi:MAG TPA: hypothetical protein VGC13_19775 [Longimicrobium sp.]|jgi:hypothetical protein|uniref:hypothetical protein n=1 Tax=Longimicrobium sp. TaxID=2029185 RepID=UPI002EDB4CCA